MTNKLPSEPYLYFSGPPESPKDPQTPKTISLELSTTDPKCCIFLESLCPDLHPPAFRSTSGPSRAPQGPTNPQNHISGTIHHRPQVLYIFGILGSRPPPSYIQITIWSEWSSDQKHWRLGFTLCEILMSGWSL